MTLVEVFSKEQQKHITEILISIKTTITKANKALDNINEITDKTKSLLK